MKEAKQAAKDVPTLESASAVPARIIPPEVNLLRERPSVGTLKYTGVGLVMIFVWLLWGDFCWTLMEAVVPTVLPLKLESLGAPNTLISWIIDTIPSILAFVLCPAISFRSDRCRSKRGRRIPFLLYSAPFVSAFLVLIGFSEDMGAALYAPLQSMLGSYITPTVSILAVMVVLVVAYQFANMFVNTVYWYLFNDVVPSKMLSQFLALFRIIGGLAGILFTKWVFPQSIEWFKWIFIVAGIFYFVAFSAMCLMVKEGKYAPPPENIDKRPGFISSAKTYFAECFTHKFYVYFFLCNTFMYMSYSIGRFMVFRNNKSLGLSLNELADVGVVVGFVTMALQWPTGWLADKYNPLRVYVISTLLLFFMNGANLLWMFQSFDHETTYWIYVLLSVVTLPIGALQGSAEIPMYMRLLPKAQYGQFCSANAMLRALGVILSSAVAGLWMDFVISYFYHGSKEGYTAIPIWQILFQSISCFFMVMVYREWKNRGGDKGYVPPDPDARFKTDAAD